MKRFIKEFKELLPELHIRQNCKLKNFHTYRIECFADYLIIVKNEKQLLSAIQICEKYKKKYILLGGGSNVLFKREFTKKIIIKLISSQIDTIDKTHFYAFAGTSVSEILSYAKSNFLTGFEWSVGIPASVGGAIYMNMGAFNHSISEIVYKIRIFQKGVVKEISSKEANFEYRNSIFRQNNCIILGAYFKLIKSEDSAEIECRMKEYLFMKKRSQPLGLASCGSVFKNGENFYVAKIIQDCGLKGLSCGDAEISKIHSNFIVNKKNAKPQDVLKLIKHIKKVVRKRYNICILCEVVII